MKSHDEGSETQKSNEWERTASSHSSHFCCSVHYYSCSHKDERGDGERREEGGRAGLLSDSRVRKLLNGPPRNREEEEEEREYFHRR
ncbi:hypothetical protein NQZ68_012308 [Dissostichus eleginoides]|nr:hypothetical protein NQZ68_012308 [Dissostichus eleginoides]